MGSLVSAGVAVVVGAKAKVAREKRERGRGREKAREIAQVHNRTLLMPPFLASIHSQELVEFDRLVAVEHLNKVFRADGMPEPAVIPQGQLSLLEQYLPSRKIVHIRSSTTLTTVMIKRRRCAFQVQKFIVVFEKCIHWMTRTSPGHSV
ncbi:hypothetical protein QOT17_015221 [Balamuthia mandrillaris]